MTLLKGIKTLFTGTEDIHGTDILIEDNRISRIERDIRVDSSGGEPPEEIDCSDMVVIPGLVNTHHHFFQTLQRCLPEVQDSPLFDWLVRLYEIWKHMDEESVYWSTLVACGELLKTGCTTTSDQLYVFPEWAGGRLAGSGFTPQGAVCHGANPPGGFLLMWWSRPRRRFSGTANA